MRYIDIYRKVSDNFILVAQDCIQTENADLTRKAVLKSFTMADGSTTLYTSGNDSAEMNLSLECSQAQIQAISEALHAGELYFTGMRAGAHPLPTPTDNDYFPAYLSENIPAFVGILTEDASVQILETAAHVDLFALKIPLKLETSGGQFKTELIPTAGLLETGGINFDNRSLHYSDFCYDKGKFILKFMLFANSDSFFVGIWGDKEDCSYQLYQNGDVKEWDDSQGDLQAECTLVSGLNTFEIKITKGENLKPVRFQVSVYRQAVST